ncbi:hypothetical protein R3I93_019983 [Phoxinus phoxinus]|uniref:PiggyBac transposable element-derived protein domain-containing protein n=1 Tax=Phoxinus phoxinus TaxID=58324 RepID=A0AAN9CCL2_9TELE
MQIYTGKPPGMPREINLGRRVVLDLVDGYQGHIVTCDNFFSSYALGTELLKMKTRMIGTIRKNKTELPSALVNTRGRATHSSLFAFTETHAIVSYLPKKNKNVLLMSTVHSDPALSERDDQKPQMILYYNRTKGGVDNLDKIVATYTCRRKTARWPMAVFYNIVDVSAYNAFVIWREVNPTWRQTDSFRRRHFLEELGRALVCPLIQSRRHIPRTLASHELVKKEQECNEDAVSSTAGPSSAGPSPPGPSPARPSRAGPSPPVPSQACPSPPGPSPPGPSPARPSRAGPSPPRPSRAGPSRAGPSPPGPSRAGPSRAGPSPPGPSPARP